MAEWLGRALQKLLQRFESARDLNCRTAFKGGFFVTQGKKYTMKHAQTIGIVALVAMFALCFLPWSYIPVVDVTVSGIQGKVSEQLNLGKPAKLIAIIGFICSVLFVIPKVWAKRINFFTTTILFSYSLYLVMLFSGCREGICPDAKWPLYLQSVMSFVAMVMSFLPKLKVRPIGEFDA